MTIAANQQPFAEALDKAGYLKLLGDANTVSAKQICSEILRHISPSIQQCKDAGGDLTDGLGASRLAIAMVGPKTPIKLRHAEEEDEALLLRWANDKDLYTITLCHGPGALLSTNLDANSFIYKDYQMAVFS